MASQVSLFDQDRLVATAAADSPAAGVPEVRYNGVLERAYTFDGLGTYESTFWVVTTSRSGSFRAVFRYQSALDQDFLIEEGTPLLMESRALTDDRLVALELIPVSDTPTIEFHGFPSDRKIPPGPNPSNFLGLSTDSGVFLGIDSRVDLWIDTRPTSTLSGGFSPVGGGRPLYTASDDDFGGWPSIEFDGTDQRLQYDGVVSDFDALGTQTVQIAVVHLPEDDAPTAAIERSLLANFDTPGTETGLEIAVTSNYIVLGRRSNDAGQSSTAEVGDPVPRAMVTYYSVSPGTGGVSGSRSNLTQGRTGAGTDPNPAGLPSPLPLTLGGRPSGSNFYKGKVVDIRIWQGAFSNDDRVAYTQWAEAKYGVNNAAFNPYTTASNLVTSLRASRGIVPDASGTVDAWVDTKNSALGQFDSITAKPGYLSNRSQSAIFFGNPNDETDQTYSARLRSSDPVANWNILRGDADFTIRMVASWGIGDVSPNSIGTRDEVASSTGQGIEVVLDKSDLVGTRNLTFKLQGTSTFASFLKRLATNQIYAIVVRYTASTRALEVWVDGSEETATTIPAATSGDVYQALTLSGAYNNGAPMTLYDVDVHTRRVADSERDGYLDWAVSRYGATK